MKITLSSIDAKVRAVYRASAAAVAVVPALVGLVVGDANTARTVLEVVAGVVVAADGALYVAQRFGLFADVNPIPSLTGTPAPAPEQKTVDKVEQASTEMATAAAAAGMVTPEAPAPPA